MKLNKFGLIFLLVHSLLVLFVIANDPALIGRYNESKLLKSLFDLLILVDFIPLLLLRPFLLFVANIGLHNLGSLTALFFLFFGGIQFYFIGLFISKVIRKKNETRTFPKLPGSI